MMADKVLNKNITFNYWIKTIPTEGFLAWEYNPLRNYRLSKDCYLYNNSYYTLLELEEKFHIWKSESGFVDDYHNPVNIGDLLKAGTLVDFDTEELNFNLEHPVHILPQYSYDGSVNLILNDGYNSPKLINTRFSPIGKFKYLIVDRTGSSDTNIYDLGEQFNLDTSLYKKITTIPKVEFKGSFIGGNLSIGNYHFYFKCVDGDGNSTDFIAESGLVSIFIGTNPKGIHTGFRNQNSNKLVQFKLTNIDSSYPYIQVYYTRASSEINSNYFKEHYKILKLYSINSNNTCNIIINGSEDKELSNLEAINTKYTIVDNVVTQTSCQNRLFLGNIQQASENYSALKEVALRFYAKPHYENYNPGIDERYNVKNIESSYYNSKFIYDKLGYWNDEYYRLGIVFILNTGTLSQVYNIRGKLNLTSDVKYTVFENAISVDENTQLLIGGNLENACGVISMKEFSDSFKIIGIKIEKDEEVLNKLKDLGVQGYFFVRQTRIPNTICQALSIATDTQSHTPIIKSDSYIAESFFSKSGELTHDFNDHKRTVVRPYNNAAICPELDVNPNYLSYVFTGQEFDIEESTILPQYDYLITSSSKRHYYNNTSVINNNVLKYSGKVISIPDGVPLITLDENNKFSSKAGNSQSIDFEFLENETKSGKPDNLVRGLFGPYLGFDVSLSNNKLITIKNKQGIDELQIRYLDKSAYNAISDRLYIDEEIPVLYRGDCYICQFTHRLNRNFNDPTAPYNDKIVNKTFTLEYDSNEQIKDLNNINIGDLNAVQLGMWVTFTLRSNYNLNIRSLDDSYVTESIATGHSRGFYPYQSMSVAGNYKLPESQVYNDGFRVSLSERWNFAEQEIPYYKNVFTNRIIYSNIDVNDTFKNGFRVFESVNYKDYPLTYGAITKLVEWGGNLICIFEHGIAKIAINERAVAADGDGGYAFINTSNVLPDNPLIISDTYGSLWGDSIIKSGKYLYGIDTVAKKIWKTDGQTIKCISDFKVQEFLNQNITLSEREHTPIIGIRNVKSFYNAFKQDIIFTFYDNLYGFNEKAWSLCYNELLDVFTTFYSWIPSMMENIDNIPFSFDRNTAKYIAKLGTNEGIVLDNNVFNKYGKIGKLSIKNRILPESYTIKYELIDPPKDSEGKYLFSIMKIENDYVLYFNSSNYYDYCTELYYRTTNNGLFKLVPDKKFMPIIIDNNYPIAKDKTGKRMFLPYDLQINPDKIVYNLNIKATITGSDESGYKQTYITDAGYYESIVTVIPEWNKQFLTTDFWKHGQAGLIDIADDVYPTYWYGKQHPFEFEFIVVNDPATHKIFSNLELVANKAKPESFHYEIIGECYDFAKDKPNMYYRLESIKELYQYNGVDITYNKDYVKTILKQLNKSADFPHIYYGRKDTFNDIEDYYISASVTENYDYRHLGGAEIVYYKNRNEYRIWQHTKAINADDLNQETARSLIAANCRYVEDRWKITINPIVICYKNESKWNKPPLTLYNSPIPDSINKETLIAPSNLLGTGIDLSDWSISRKEIDLKDKFMKVRIRYSGEDLAIIDFINTIYRISYS